MGQDDQKGPRRVALPQPRGGWITLDELLRLLSTKGGPPPSDWPNLEEGDEVEKAWSEDGDSHAEGHRGVVVRRLPNADEPPLAYMILWEGESEPCFVSAVKLRAVHE